MVATALEKFYSTEFPELRVEPLGDTELEMMLKLVLGCLVQCPAKEQYIGQIMGLEEGVQRELMVLISEVMQEYPGAVVEVAPASPCFPTPTKTAPITPAKLFNDSEVQDITIRAHKMKREIDALKEERDDFAKTAKSKTHEAKTAREEAEKQRKDFELRLAETSNSLKEMECKYLDCHEKSQHALLEEQENIQSAANKSEEHEKKLTEEREENAKLSDELDTLRPLSIEVEKLNRTVEKYKAKLEDSKAKNTNFQNSQEQNQVCVWE